jgi:hypothetical protein
VAPSKADALLYKRFLDEFGMVTSEVLISAPDTRDGHSDVDEVDDTANRPSVLDFWARMMKRFGSEENYRKDIISRFKHADDPRSSSSSTCCSRGSTPRAMLCCTSRGRSRSTRCSRPSRG